MVKRATVARSKLNRGQTTSGRSPLALRNSMSVHERLTGDQTTDVMAIKRSRELGLGELEGKGRNCFHHRIVAHNH